MHVLIIPSWYPKNTNDINGSFFREQALALHKHGCKVGVIFQEVRSLREWKSTIANNKKYTIENDEGVKTYRSYVMNWLPRTSKPSMKLFAWEGIKLYQKYVEENGTPDIVHVHSILNAGLIAEEIYKKKGVPFLITEHSSIYSRNLITKEKLRVAKKCAALAKHRFAVSQEFAKILNKLIGSDDKPWQELPNIVSNKFINHPISLNKTKKFHFINVAFMNENKKQINIIKAFEIINKKYSDTALTIVGDGPERKRLEKLTISLGLENKIIFTGLLPREKVLNEIAYSDAFILSSDYETFGVVLVESLALGKPVIATKCGGPESIIRKEDGILIPVNNIDALVDAMDEIINNKNNYNQTEIRRSCIDRFSEDSIAKRLLEIYNNVKQEAP